MCGRYASTRSTADLVTLFEALDETEDRWTAPDYNVAPTDPAPIVRHTQRSPRRVLSVARWGLVPPWSRDASGAARMINARAETVATSRAFAGPFQHHRCLVPAEGWYEWRLEKSGKQPYFMTRDDGETLVFAGIWSASEAYGERALTFSVLTVAAVDPFTHVHARMPLVLPPAQWSTWLTAQDPTGLLRAPDPAYAAGIRLRPVSAAVGDVRNDGPQLIREVPLKTDHDDCAPTLF